MATLTKRLRAPMRLFACSSATTSVGRSGYYRRVNFNARAGPCPLPRGPLPARGKRPGVASPVLPLIEEAVRGFLCRETFDASELLEDVRLADSEDLAFLRVKMPDAADEAPDVLAVVLEWDEVGEAWAVVHAGPCPCREGVVTEAFAVEDSEPERRLAPSPASRMGLSGAAFQPLKRWIYDDSRRVTPSLHLRGSSSGQAPSLERSVQRHGAGVVHEDPVVFAGDSDSYQRPLSETDEMPEGDIGDPLFDEGVGSTVAGMGGVEGGGAFGATSASAMLDEATRGHGLYGDMRPGHARAQREGAEVDVKGARPWERGGEAAGVAGEVEVVRSEGESDGEERVDMEEWERWEREDREEWEREHLKEREAKERLCQEEQKRWDVDVVLGDVEVMGSNSDGDSESEREEREREEERVARQQRHIFNERVLLLFDSYMHDAE